MTEEELINLARQANGEETWPGGVDWTWEELHTFAKLVAEQAQKQEPVMVDIQPPATQRDRWMYEQGRLAERDSRTHEDRAWDLAEKVRVDLDRQSCPGFYMNLATESVVKHCTSPPQRQPLTDEQINEIADEFIVNYRIPAGSHYDFVRAIEAAHGIKE